MTMTKSRFALPPASGRTTRVMILTFRRSCRPAWSLRCRKTKACLISPARRSCTSLRRRMTKRKLQLNRRRRTKKRLRRLAMNRRKGPMRNRTFLRRNRRKNKFELARTNVLFPGKMNIPGWPTFGGGVTCWRGVSLPIASIVGAWGREAPRSGALY